MNITDTPQYIKDLQLKIWLSKSPGERLLQALKNNEETFLFFKQAKEAMQRRKDQRTSPTNPSSE